MNFQGEERRNLSVIYLVSSLSLEFWKRGRSFGFIASGEKKFSARNLILRILCLRRFSLGSWTRKDVREGEEEEENK